MHYGMLLDLSRCVACGGCVMACKRVNGTLGDVYWSNVYTQEVGTYPNAHLKSMPMGCMHCEEAPCVAHCPTGASYRTEDGFVLVDQDKCIGCRACVSACPYNARHLNLFDPVENPYWGDGHEQMPFEKITTAKHVKGTAEKCVFCHDRVKAGIEPACVRTCVASARMFGDLDDPNSQISKEIHRKKAEPLATELGTKPSVYYVGQ